MKIRKGRAQGLKGALGRIGDITNYIKKLLKKKKRVKILEVGTGYGRALIELKKIFKDKIDIHGTNLESKWNQTLIKKYALSQKFSSKNIPKIYILDAGKKLPFKSNSFDFVFCQATMQYILNRALFIEEVNRILTKDGIAVLELQEFRNDHPKEYKNMIEILDKGKKVNTLKYFKKFKNIQIKKSKERDWHYLIIKKIKKLNLKLKFVKSIDLEKISPNFWGKKVFYGLKRG